MTARTPFILPIAGAVLALLMGCAPTVQSAPPMSTPVPVGPPAFWLVTVDGPMELDHYVARVCTQENGAAAFEALKAQAVAARTYVLRAMRDEKPIGTPEKPIPNSQEFQAYAPVASAACAEATRQTRGLVLRYQGQLIVANYVAGARLRDDGTPGDDPTRTEKWVTYNGDRFGPQVIPTPLSRTDRSDNRGCMSQNGADWMARRGFDFVRILRFYYGQDAAIVW
ncbi:MAG: hypothetical protein IPK82_02545 [Polyangiaceae bacterium]|nr:hypothetical protein [Polyangiaceae bacterium]